MKTEYNFWWQGSPSLYFPKHTIQYDIRISCPTLVVKNLVGFFFAKNAEKGQKISEFVKMLTRYLVYCCGHFCIYPFL